jgi:hypothetical protein
MIGWSGTTSLPAETRIFSPTLGGVIVTAFIRWEVLD